MALPLYYNWRNLFVRKLSTTLTFTVVTVVVAVLAVLLSFAEGIRASLRATGSPRNLMVIQSGATAESTSILRPDEASKLVQAPGIAMDQKGDAMISQELCVQTSIPRKDAAGTIANVAVRGVDLVAIQIHPEVRLIEGRMFNSGAAEVIVGKAAHRRFRNLDVGDEVAMGRAGNRKYKVVGVFEAGGGALENEIWAARGLISDSYVRRFSSSAVLRLNDQAPAKEAIEYINGPAVGLKASLETEYYEELTSKTRDIVFLTSILITIMAIGAAFAVANTMYAAVDGRRREIAMLRTIGFSRSSIVVAFVIESLLICITACLVGLAISTFANRNQQDFLSDTTWTVLAYDPRITPKIIFTALSIATLVGVVGALAPAVRASRTRIIEALRKA